MHWKTSILLAALFVLLMSLPWLVPYMGWTALVGLVPLLILERLATEKGQKHFWWWHYGLFVAWNAVTTWWVGNATVGGAVFAILANSLQMSLVFGAFRWVKRRTAGALPYLFLAAAWIAWERYYLTIAEISWPWLVLGNAFAETTGLVQWYSVLGSLGGSLWVWTVNLSVFGLMVALSDGRMARWNAKARVAAFAGAAVALFGPMLWSVCLPAPPEGEEKLHVVIGQPSFDPYQKFESLTQAQQDARYLGLLQKADWQPGRPALVLAPETFTAGLVIDDAPNNETFKRFQGFLKQHPDATLLFGASTWERSYSATAPHPCAYDMGAVAGTKDHAWIVAHNSALLTDSTGRHPIYHKSKLVVGTELTPYPRLFIPLEKLVSGGKTLMAKDVGQKEISCLPLRLDGRTVPVGTAVCYESVYGEFCAGYVQKGAELLAVITNDAWWGNTPGYRQHLSYSRLRAIETRRWVARCANTGISAIIDPQGHVVQKSAWWEPALLEGEVGLSRQQSFFVRYGDITGRVAVLLFLLLGAAAVFRPLKKKR